MLTSRISGGCCALHGAREKEVSNRGGNGVKEVWDRHREIAQSRGATAACILGGPRLWNGRREQYTCAGGCSGAAEKAASRYRNTGRGRGRISFHDCPPVGRVVKGEQDTR